MLLLTPARDYEELSKLITMVGTLFVGSIEPKKFTPYGLVKLRANTMAKVSVPEFEQHKTISAPSFEIPPDLILNWDHTIPVSSWTMAKQGSGDRGKR